LANERRREYTGCVRASALVLLLVVVTGCQSGGQKDYPAPPSRAALGLEPGKDAEPTDPVTPQAPPAPEPCKHRFEAVRQGTHPYTVYEDEVPVVKLCTPIVCTKCGIVRHECQRELVRRRR
jgi:hypothetical protein